MLQLNDLIPQSHIFVPIKSAQKKSAIKTIADKISVVLSHDLDTDIAPNILFEALMQRELLGSTGVGNGVALPHARLKNINSVSFYFARCDKPIPFDAIDDLPIDLMFILVSPEDAGSDHLKALARISRIVRSTQNMNLLRNAKDVSAAFAVISSFDISSAA